MTSNAGQFKKATSFQANLLRTDTAQLTRILIIPKNKVKTELTFNREENGWILTHLIKNIRVEPITMEAILTSLTAIKPNRVVANQSEDWATYGVDVLQSTKVSAFVGSEKVIDFIIGKSKMSKFKERMTSFIRIDNGVEVYEIDGIYSLFNQQFDNYRNQTILKLDPSRVQQIKLQNDEVLLDSITKLTYFNAISTLQSQNFADNFDETAAVDNLLKTLTIHLDDTPNLVKISLFYDSMAVQPFIIHSSLNKDTYFASDSAGLYAKIFQPLITLDSIPE
jgi:hypothetical protein